MKLCRIFCEIVLDIPNCETNAVFLHIRVQNPFE